jgi:hypothetical protein
MEAKDEYDREKASRLAEEARIYEVYIYVCMYIHLYVFISIDS